MLNKTKVSKFTASFSNYFQYTGVFLKKIDID